MQLSLSSSNYAGRGGGFLISRSEDPHPLKAVRTVYCAHRQSRSRFTRLFCRIIFLHFFNGIFSLNDAKGFKKKQKGYCLDVQCTEDRPRPWLRIVTAILGRTPAHFSLFPSSSSRCARERQRQVHIKVCALLLLSTSFFSSCCIFYWQFRSFYCFLFPLLKGGLVSPQLCLTFPFFLLELSMEISLHTSVNHVRVCSSVLNAIRMTSRTMKYDELQRRRRRRRKKREEKIKRENEAGRDLRPSTASRRAGSQHPSRGRSGKLQLLLFFKTHTGSTRPQVLENAPFPTSSSSSQKILLTLSCCHRRSDNNIVQPGPVSFFFWRLWLTVKVSKKYYS